MKKVKTYGEKIKYGNPVVQILSKKVEFDPDHIEEWEYPNIADGVSIIAINEANEIYLVKEWCFAWDTVILSLPSGKVFPTSLNPKVVAINELREELGLNAKTIKEIGEYYVTSGIRMKYYLYVAKDLFISPKNKDKYEDLEIIKMPITEAIDTFSSGKVITTSNTLAALFMYLNKVQSS